MSKKLLSLLFVIVLCLSMCLPLAGCGSKDHTCMKCKGSGMVRDSYGYYAYVTCPRCGGSGTLKY